jgi:hypothetical protein
MPRALLEGLDLRRDRGLGEVKLVRRSAKVQRICNDAEYPQLEVFDHGVAPIW